MNRNGSTAPPPARQAVTSRLCASHVQPVARRARKRRHPTRARDSRRSEASARGALGVTVDDPPLPTNATVHTTNALALRLARKHSILHEALTSSTRRWSNRRINDARLFSRSPQRMNRRSGGTASGSRSDLARTARSSRLHLFGPGPEARYINVSLV